MAAVGHGAAEPLAQPAPDVRVRLLRLRRGRVPPGADRPDRLVGDDESGGARRQAIEAVLDLPIEHRERFVPLALLERLADADDRRQAAGDRRGHLAVDDRIGFAEQPPPLGVADDHVLAPASLSIGGHLAGERAFALPVDVLRGDADVRAACGSRHGLDRGERRRDDDLDAGDVLHQCCSSFAKTTASLTVLNIFQLPAMRGVLMLMCAGQAGTVGRAIQPLLPIQPFQPILPCPSAPRRPAASGRREIRATRRRRSRCA